MQSSQFSEHDLEELKKATAFSEILPVILKALERVDGPIAELCGPMTSGGSGSYEENILTHAHATQHLEKHGVTVFELLAAEDAINRVVRSYDDHDQAQTELLEQLFQEIFESGNITQAYFLPGWQTSNGASWEYTICQRLAIPVIEMPEDWKQRTDYIRTSSN